MSLLLEELIPSCFTLKSMSRAVLFQDPNPPHRHSSHTTSPYWRSCRFCSSPIRPQTLHNPKRIKLLFETLSAQPFGLYLERIETLERILLRHERQKLTRHEKSEVGKTTLSVLRPSLPSQICATARTSLSLVFYLVSFLLIVRWNL